MADISNKDLLAAQKESNQTLLKINASLQQQLDGVKDAIKAPPKKNIEEVKEKKAENKKFLDALKGIVSAGAGGVKSVGKDVAKTTGGFLAKFLKFGLAAVMLPLLALIGGVAGIFKSITSTKEFTFLSSILKTIGKTSLGFIRFMGRIAQWMLDLASGGKLGTGLGKVFGSLGERMSGMFKGWTSKIATFMENPKIVAVMEKVSKFLRPFMRLAFWFFSGYEFLKGWKKADEIFGKGEGEATIVEKFAGGIAGILDFLAFGLIDSEKAAHLLKDTFEFFKLAVTKPKEAWKKVTDWWDAWDFHASIVDPMIKMFDDFPKKVREFIDGPLSNFGSKAVDMLKGFIFGKDDPESTEGTGGLWGGVKSLFSVENVTKAIVGLVKLTAGFYGMLGSLVSIPWIGTKGKWSDLDSWGGILGWFKNDFFNWENIKSAVTTISTGAKNLANWAKSIFWHDDGESGLLQRLMGWIEEKFDIKLEMPDWDIGGKIKEIVRNMIKGLPDLIVPNSVLNWAGLKQTPPPEAPPTEGSDKSFWDKTKGFLGFGTKETKPPTTAKDILKSGAITMASGTRESSFGGLSDDAKIKANTLASMFGGLRITSGFRDPKRGDDAMLHSKEGLSKYKAKWRKLLTPEELNAAAGSEARKRGIAKMRAGGFSSQHEHGNALDFSYPVGFSENNFSELKAKVLSAFPGANLIKEKDHLHMAFNPKTSGMQLAQAASQKGLLQGGAGGSGGNTNNIQMNGGNHTEQNIAVRKPIRNSHVAESHSSTWYDPHSWF